jgi:hypothetical protein
MSVPRRIMSLRCDHAVAHKWLAEVLVQEPVDEIDWRPTCPAGIKTEMTAAQKAAWKTQGTEFLARPQAERSAFAAEIKAGQRRHEGR